MMVYAMRLRILEMTDSSRYLAVGFEQAPGRQRAICLARKRRRIGLGVNCIRIAGNQNQELAPGRTLRLKQQEEVFRLHMCRERYVVVLVQRPNAVFLLPSIHPPIRPSGQAGGGRREMQSRYLVQNAVACRYPK